MSKRYREYGLALLMLAASGALLLVLLGEWLHYRRLASEIKSQLATKAEVRLQAAPKEEQPYELPSLDKYIATVERPLFMESRRPAEVDDSAPQAAAAPKLPLNAKLMGVVFAPGQKPLGLFVDAKGKYKRRRSDDEEPLDGWKVVEIEPDKAVLEQDGTREELKLLKPKPKRSPIPQPANAPPAGAPGVPVAPGSLPPPGAAGQMPEPPPDETDGTETPPEEEPVDESEQPNPDEVVDEIPVEPEETPPEEQ